MKTENKIYYHDCGYRMLRIPGHHLANSVGLLYEHRLVAEKMLGRRLKKGEFVHHKNGNPIDNRPMNFEITSNSAHMKHHARERLISMGIDPDLERRCYICKKVKLRKFFSPSSCRGRPCLNSACRPCAMKFQREYRRKNRLSINRRRREIYEAKKGVPRG